MDPALALLIPAFNAESTLGPVLDEILPLGPPVLVVDDGSGDGTGAVAESRGVAFLESHSLNQGKGAALKTGFARAAREGFTHVLTLDADGQHPVESIPAFLRRCGEKPEALLLGNRFADPTIQAMPWVRRLSNGVSSRLISLAAGAPIPDAQCGMRVYPLAILDRFSLESDGYALETEVLVKARRAGVEVENIPIACHYPQGTAASGYRAFSDSWKIAKTVARAVREGKSNR